MFAGNLLVHFLDSFEDQKQSAEQQNEISAGNGSDFMQSLGFVVGEFGGRGDFEPGVGSSNIGPGKDRRRQTHDPADAQQQPDSHDQSDRQTDSATGAAFFFGQAISQDRDEDDVVDSEHDFHRGQSDQSNQKVHWVFRNNDWPDEKVVELAESRSVQRP